MSISNTNISTVTPAAIAVDHMPMMMFFRGRIHKFRRSVRPLCVATQRYSYTLISVCWLYGRRSRDIHSHIVKDMDRQIVSSFNNHKETRSMTVRFSSAVSAGPHLKHGIGHHPGDWQPVRRQAQPGWHDGVPADGHGNRLHT